MKEEGVRVQVQVFGSVGLGHTTDDDSDYDLRQEYGEINLNSYFYDCWLVAWMDTEGREVVVWNL